MIGIQRGYHRLGIGTEGAIGFDTNFRRDSRLLTIALNLLYGLEVGGVGFVVVNGPRVIPSSRQPEFAPLAGIFGGRRAREVGRQRELEDLRLLLVVIRKRPNFRMHEYPDVG